MQDTTVGGDADSCFRQLAENIPQCFWLYDLGECRVVFVNAAYARIWGEPPENLLTDPQAWLLRAHAEDLPRLQSALGRASLGGLDEEVRIVRADGGIRWIRMRSFPIRNASGIVGDVGMIVDDITPDVDQRTQMQLLAHFDSLTALPNRFLFRERLGAAVAV